MPGDSETLIDDPDPFDDPFTENAHVPPSATAMSVPFSPPPPVAAGVVGSGFAVGFGSGFGVVVAGGLQLPPPVTAFGCVAATGSAVAVGAALAEATGSAVGAALVAAGAALVVEGAADTSGVADVVAGAVTIGTVTAPLDAAFSASGALFRDMTRIATSAGSSTATAASAPTMSRLSSSPFRGGGCVWYAAFGPEP